VKLRQMKRSSVARLATCISANGSAESLDAVRKAKPLLSESSNVVGEVRTAVVPTRRKRDLQAQVRAHVKAKSALYTDALMSYDGLSQNYAHKVIDHAEKYVDGKIHTNGLENFWSLLKRGISGTYVSVEPFYLFRYLDEQTFRYNKAA
jgi:transposase-like protein